ncbi:MAG: exonuclease SbcCD subunit D [Anaerolineales bacterium]|nr:exonuclease SbcCD subunit D [Anaerolineales bacterium]
MRLLHFADAHIDMANYGRHDAESGLPLRVLDFLKSLDTIVDAAIREKVDLVIFAGDAYKDRAPSPTFQREWGRRIIRLSKAGIPTLLLIGNHDLSPAIGRANAIQEFDTLEVPNVRVISRPCFLSADDLGLPLQVIAIPWISRSGLLASMEMSAAEPSEVFTHIEARITELVNGWLDEANPELPLILTAHASVQGAKYGSERTVMLGADLVLPGSLVKDPRLDYVALGHIHKPQNLNESAHPPVIYPGSIERVDFGEAADEKFFVIAQVERGQTEVEWRQLTGIRPFFDCYAQLKSADRVGAAQNVTASLRSSLPAPKKLAGAIVRLIVEYPREWETLIDEAALREHAAGAFEFHLVKRPQMESRIRLPADQPVSSLSPLELLEQYWRASHTDPAGAEALQKLAGEILSEE